MRFNRGVLRIEQFSLSEIHWIFDTADALQRPTRDIEKAPIVKGRYSYSILQTKQQELNFI
jgi:aspartate carbamoyltransferase catalytic subunit